MPASRGQSLAAPTPPCERPLSRCPVDRTFPGDLSICCCFRRLPISWTRKPRAKLRRGAVAPAIAAVWLERGGTARLRRPARVWAADRRCIQNGWFTCGGAWPLCGTVTSPEPLLDVRNCRSLADTSVGARARRRASRGIPSAAHVSRVGGPQATKPCSHVWACPLSMCTFLCAHALRLGPAACTHQM